MAQSVEDALVVRMEASLRKFERQMEAGRKAAEKSAMGAEKAWKRGGQQIAANANHASTGLLRMTNVSRQGRFVLQNTANQIGDIAIQAEMGTDAFRIMGQQVPQILGGFGALSGVLGVLGPLMGTVAALAFPLASVLLRTGEDSEEGAKKVDTFTKSLEATSAAISRAQSAIGNMSQKEMEEVYGDLTEKVKSLVKELADIELRAAKLSMSDLLDFTLDEKYRSEIERLFGTVGEALASSGSNASAEMADEMREQIRQLETDIGTFELTNQPVPPALTNQLAEMREELAAIEGRYSDIGTLADGLAASPEVLQSFASLEERMEAAREAGDFSAIADLLSDMRAILDGLGQAIDQDVKDRITQAEDKARQMANAMDESVEAAGEFASMDLASGVNSAAAAAQVLADNLGLSLELAGKIVAKTGEVGGVAQDPTVAGYENDDPRGAPSGVWTGGYSTSYRPDRGKKKRGRTGSSRLASDIEREAQALLRAARSAETYHAVLAELNAMHDSGEISTAKYEAAVTKLDERYKNVIDSGFEFKDLQQDLKESILDFAAEGVDSFDSLAKAIKRAAFEYLLFGDGKQGGGGIFGGLLGGIFGGGGGILGGLLGQSAMAPPAIPKTAAPAQQSGKMDVRVFVDENGNWQAAVENIAGPVAAQVSSAQLTQYRHKAFKADFDKAKSSPRMVSL